VDSELHLHLSRLGLHSTKRPNRGRKQAVQPQTVADNFLRLTGQARQRAGAEVVSCGRLWVTERLQGGNQGLRVAVVLHSKLQLRF